MHARRLTISASPIDSLGSQCINVNACATMYRHRHSWQPAWALKTSFWGGHTYDCIASDGAAWSKQGAPIVGHSPGSCRDAPHHGVRRKLWATGKCRGVLRVCLAGSSGGKRRLALVELRLRVCRRVRMFASVCVCAWARCGRCGTARRDGLWGRKIGCEMADVLVVTSGRSRMAAMMRVPSHVSCSPQCLARPSAPGGGVHFHNRRYCSCIGDMAPRASTLWTLAAGASCEYARRVLMAPAAMC